MGKLDFVRSYNSLVSALRRSRDNRSAMERAVGGNFDAIGFLERELLIQYGLQPDHYLIDVGCGSGRLAKALSSHLTGRYLGTDVVPDLIDHARRITNRPDWRFEVTGGMDIPERDGDADMICFFSIFTHLLQEQAYRYLCEAKRVVKPDGKIIFSFLEFRIHDQWVVFQKYLDDSSESSPLVMFTERDAIDAWARHIGLTVERYIDGNRPHIPIPHAISFDDGTTVSGKARLGPIGQSVCVLRQS